MHNNSMRFYKQTHATRVFFSSRLLTVEDCAYFQCHERTHFTDLCRMMHRVYTLVTSTNDTRVLPLWFWTSPGSLLFSKIFELIDYVSGPSTHPRLIVKVENTILLLYYTDSSAAGGVWYNMIIVMRTCTGGEGKL